MKAFQFRLERVLQWRSTQLRAAEEKLAQLHNQLSMLVGEEEAAVASYRQCTTRLVSSEILQGAELQALSAFRERTERTCQNLRAQRAQCEALIADQRQRLLKARKEHLVLEKLKERQLKNWVYLSDREIENTAADAYLANWAGGNARDRRH